MALVARPLSVSDLGPLEAIELRHLEAFGGDALVTAASLGYYQRSGHAFVVERAGAAVGFVLARALWDGRRATVSAARFALADPGDEAAADALLAALTKSAYDAGAYRLELQLDDGAGSAIARSLDSGFRRSGITQLVRTLGSGGG